MNALSFEDVGGNRLRYTIAHPTGLDRWRLDDFLEFMKLAPNEADAGGFQFSSSENLWHERFRTLVNQPESTLNPPLAFLQNGQPIGRDGEFNLAETAGPVDIDRVMSDPPAKHPGQISLRDRHCSIFKLHQPLLTDAIDQTVNRELPPDSPPFSFSILTDRTGNPETQLAFLLHAARAIHRATFENWSKFEAAVPFRNGYEMWLNYINEAGGVCSEKTASFKFLCDLLGLKTRPVIGTAQRLTPEAIEALGNYYLSGGETPPPCEIKHLLLEVTLGPETYLVDVTGGNVPLLFLNQADAAPFFKAGYSVRMVSRNDRLFLSRVPEWIGDAHLLVCEFHLPDAHFDLAFEQDLGLEISDDQYLAAFFDYGGEQSARMRAHFEKLGARQKLDPPIFINAQTKSIPATGRGFDFFQSARSSILECYPDKNYTGDITLVLQPLQNNFWRQPMISRELNPIIEQSLDAFPA